MTTPLSRAAAAVLDAFENASDGEYVEGVWVVNERTMLAAAMRAAADQMSCYQSKKFLHSIADATKLRAIADELEAH
jgi:hypothetical protein